MWLAEQIEILDHSSCVKSTSCLLGQSVLVYKSPLPGNFYVVVRRLGHEEFPGDLHLCCLCREVAEEAAFLFDEEKLGQLFRLGLQDLDPLLEFGDQIVKFHGARHTKVKV